MAKWPICTLMRTRGRWSGTLGHHHAVRLRLTTHSKSELKKRQKQREQEEKKKAKAAAAPPKAEKAGKKPASAEEEEAELTPNVRVPNDIINLLAC